MYDPLNLKDRVPKYPGRVQLVPVDGQVNKYDMALADEPTQEGDKVSAAVFQYIEKALIEQGNLFSDSVRGAVAYPKIENSRVTQILYKNGDTVIRTDLFAYTDKLITETRTLNTGETVTFKYHLDTLQTEVI